MKRSRSALNLLFVVVVALSPSFGLGSRGALAGATLVDPPIGVLAEFDVDQLPSRHAEFWFMRIVLEPGGSFPVWWKSGLTIYVIESGELTINANGSVFRGDARVTAMQPTTLEPGDSVYAPRDILIEATNKSGEPVTFLMVLLIFTTGDDENQKVVDDPVDMTLTRLAYGTAEFQPGPATITIDRVSVLPGRVLESPRVFRTDLGYGWMGLDAGTVETGMGRATILHRSEQSTIMRPDGMSLGGQYPPVKFETELTFPAGWGYFFYNAELTWTSTGNEPLTILRVIIGRQGLD